MIATLANSAWLASCLPEYVRFRHALGQVRAEQERVLRRHSPKESGQRVRTPSRVFRHPHRARLSGARAVERLQRLSRRRRQHRRRRVAGAHLRTCAPVRADQRVVVRGQVDSLHGLPQATSFNAAFAPGSRISSSTIPSCCTARDTGPSVLRRRLRRSRRPAYRWDSRTTANTLAVFSSGSSGR